MRATDEATGFVSTAPRRLGGDRAAALFVGLPLTVALVLAAAPLSEPPAHFSPSALPARMTTIAPSPAPRAAFPRTIVVPRVGAAGRAPGAGRGATIARARPPLAPRSMVVVARGVERVEIQSP